MRSTFLRAFNALLSCCLSATLVSGCRHSGDANVSQKPATSTQGSSSPQRRTTAVPSDHSFDIETGFVASDLAHGYGTTCLAVTRAWRGTGTLNSHFGPGWSDGNIVRLCLISKNLLLIWRGGVSSQLAYRTSGNIFETDDSEKIERTDQGWVKQTHHGDVLMFDTSGRLLSEKPAAGAVRAYSYDKSGRLASVGTGPENALRYEYDKAGRVITIGGPEELRLQYRYDAKGRLISVTNARKVRLDYRYSDTGTLLACC
jgi:YD repeat-containing protein